MAEGVRHGSWWTEETGKAHGDVAARLSFLTEQNQEMRLDNLLYLNIASNWNPDGSGTGYGPEYWRTSEHKIRRNICASGLDTAASLMAAWAAWDLVRHPDPDRPPRDSTSRDR